MAAMKAAILFATALVFTACAAPTTGPSAGTGTAVPIRAAAIIPQGTELRLDIIELTCHSCAGQVANGTSRIPGVLHVSAEMLDHILIVRYDPTQLTEATLTAAIDKVVDAIVN